MGHERLATIMTILHFLGHNPTPDEVEDIFGSGISFEHFVETVYIPVELPLLASSTLGRYRGILRNYLVPAVGKDLLRDLTTLRLQGYVSSLANSPGFQSHESKDKIRDVLSSVLSAAVKY